MAGEIIRPLGIFERALFLSDQHQPFNVVSVLRLESPPPPQTVQRALSFLQQRHPLLRACIKDGAFVNLSPSSSFYTIESQNDHLWLEIVEQEMNTRLEATDTLFRVNYIYFPNRADLILTFHHSIMDAASGMNLLDELMWFCADKNTPLPPLEVVPPVEERFPRSFRGLPGLVKLFSYGLAQMAGEVQYQWKMRGKRKSAVHLGGRGFPLPLVLPEPLVDELSKKCRLQKVTLNSLLNAALLLADNRLFYGGESRLMQTFSFADLRPYTVPPMHAENLANYISMLRYTVGVSGENDIWDITRRLHEKIYRSFKQGDKFLASRMSESLIKMFYGLKSMRMGASALNYSGAVSLESQYGEIKVKGLHAFLSASDLGPELSAQVRIFNNELWIDFMFLESDMDRETAEKIVGEVKAILEGAGKG